MRTVLLGLLLFLLLGPALAIASTGPKQHRPAQVWRGFSGPAYLPGHLSRRPAQHVLDSLAVAARHRPTKWVSIPTQQRPPEVVAPSH
jgi:hypothetical protein